MMMCVCGADSSFRDISALNAMTYGTSVPVDIPMYHKRPVTANPSSVSILVLLLLIISIISIVVMVVILSNDKNLKFSFRHIG